MLVKSSAQLRFLSIPPRKMRLVADTVKGLPVEKALGILNFTPRIAAHHLAKTLKSAAANALSKEGTDRLNAENLTIKNIVVDEAPTAKRIRFRSMGRVYRYRKRFCHLKVELEGQMDVVEEKKAAPSKVSAKDSSTTKTTKTAKSKTVGKKSTAAKKKATKPVAKKTASSKATTEKATAKAKPKAKPDKDKEAEK